MPRIKRRLSQSDRIDLPSPLLTKEGGKKLKADGYLSPFTTANTRRP